MNILMMTNTYLPHVGGVARSVAAFTAAFRAGGHRVLVVAPTFAGMEEHEEGVIRLPAIQQFNGSDFSVQLPIPGLLSGRVDRFEPAIVHAHHPYLLGAVALRIATSRGLPLVFTHHTMYERYTHYVPGDSPAMQRFVIRMVTGYANLCDHVVAPSASIKKVLQERGVTAPVTPIPTGIDPARFRNGDGSAMRCRLGIAADEPVIGHVGRLAPEKNLGFLAEAVAACLKVQKRARFLVAGVGPFREEIERVFARTGLSDRLLLLGILDGDELAGCYQAMDLFAFASLTETQGMVLAEAMTAGVPVVAIDAPGVREVVRDGLNGRLLPNEDLEGFTKALLALLDMNESKRATMCTAARRTARCFSLDRCAERLLAVYEELITRKAKSRLPEDSPWSQAVRMLEIEWELWRQRAEAAVKSVTEDLT